MKCQDFGSVVGQCRMTAKTYRRKDGLTILRSFVGGGTQTWMPGGLTSPSGRHHMKMIPIIASQEFMTQRRHSFSAACMKFNSTVTAQTC